tara:strand:- start:1451 stop:2728 length:1278 start_codon:yes stop_codon:yes gene_type:complete
MKQTLVISCPASSRSGYGDHSRDLIRSLIAMDRFDIKIMDQRWGNCPRTALTHDEVISKLILPRGPLQFQPDVWIQVTVPNEFQPIGKGMNIGITAGIESNRVEPDWVEGCNRMDLIIVPSEHSRATLVDTKWDTKDNNGDIVKTVQVNKPVEVLLEGLDIDIFDKTDKDNLVNINGLNDIKESFCFLTVGHWLQGNSPHDRKDIGGTLHTFLETFRNMKVKPALVIKTSSATFSVMDRYDMIKRIKEIRNSFKVKELPNIYLLHGDLTPQEMNSLYNHPKIKAMVSFTHGEGFGRPLLEFSVTGKPTIASSWSGHTDFLKENAFLLPGELKEIDQSALQKGIFSKGAMWFYVNYNVASKLLKNVYKKYKEYTTVSRRQRKFVKDNFTIEKMNNDFTKIINDNVPEPVKLNLPKLKLPKLEKVNE